MSLSLHGEEVETMFDLLGYNENSLTYALGWSLSEHDNLVKELIEHISNKKYNYENIKIRLQEYRDRDKGFTDIELEIDNDLTIIIEAKKGWNLPTKEQLQKYMVRFRDNPIKDKMCIVLSECSKEYAMHHLKMENYNYPVNYISWREVIKLLDKVNLYSNNYQKRLMRSLKKYLSKGVSMQDKDSNRVFCVALAKGTSEWYKMSWIDIVEKERKYFYPISGRTWPPDPPNYIAFRYDGKLQSIHHVDSYIITSKLYEHLPTDEVEEGMPLFLLSLGKPFKPAHEVRNGKIYPSGHIWFDLDTVFVYETIKKARDVSLERRG